MKWTEALTIYLAVGAPFGVIQFLNSRSEKTAILLVKAVGMTALWPAFAYRSTLAWNTGANSTDGMSEEISFESREYEARREFEAALNTVETLVRGTALTDICRAPAYELSSHSAP